MREVGAALGLSENAAHMRVNRALEKLRKFFTAKGVVLTASIIAGSISAHSVRAAPATLAHSITVAAAQGATATGSTAALVKGALKLMAWTKAKGVLVAGTVVLLTGGITGVVIEKALVHSGFILEQRLEDGSVLKLTRISYGEHGEAGHGNQKHVWNWPRPELNVEFQLLGSYAGAHLLVHPKFFRQYRCIFHGENGIEYVDEFWPFKQDPEGFFGHIEAGAWPRDAKWLWFRIEKREDSKRYDQWQKVAEFKTANPGKTENHSWKAGALPATNLADGLSVILKEVSVQNVPNLTNDIWNHIVSFPYEIRDGGILLTNWTAAYAQVEDASGNTYPLRRHLSVDPRYVWKIDLDLEPATNFAATNMAAVNIWAKTPLPLVTNILGIPITFTSDGSWINADMPTNRSDLALKLVGVQNSAGLNVAGGSGSWNRHFFRTAFHAGDENLVKVTLAIVPNVHTTFYVQPRLIPK